MEKPETRFKKKFYARLKEISNVWYTKTQQRSIRGTPDLLLCVSGMFVAVELKANRAAKIDHLQSYTLERINLSGGLGIVCFPENLDKVIGVIKILAEGGTYDRNNNGAIALRRVSKDCG